MKKVLILSGSPRKDGNSDLLCSEFMRGAQESGNEVQKIFVRSKKIVPCNACYYCRDHGGKCVLNDDMSEILDAMQAADVIVMASPVYFYSIDAQMKIIIEDILPCQLGITYWFRYCTWQETEGYGLTWGDLDAMTWHGWETYHED